MRSRTRLPVAGNRDPRSGGGAEGDRRETRQAVVDDARGLEIGKAEQSPAFASVPRAGHKDAKDAEIFIFPDLTKTVEENFARYKEMFAPPEGKTVDDIAKMAKIDGRQGQGRDPRHGRDMALQRAPVRPEIETGNPARFAASSP